MLARKGAPRRDAADLRVGCAGWSLPSKWADRFPGEGSHLERYARVFSCVEINSSFYRPHQEKTYRRWAQSVPGDFRFSVKVPRVITHDLRLARCDYELRAFLDQVGGLEAKLGCLLLQLPPSLALDVPLVNRFLALLRGWTQVKVVCEPRHGSWFTEEGAAVLRDFKVSRVWAHPAPVKEAEPLPDAGTLYLRLHGTPQIYYSAYDDDFIVGIPKWMQEAQAQGREAWCIFDNTARGEAIPNALSLMELCHHPA